MWPRNAAAPKPVNIPQANGVPNIDAPSPVRPPKPATTVLQPPASEIAQGTNIITPAQTTIILITSVITVALCPVRIDYKIATPAIKNVANV